MRYTEPDQPGSEALDPARTAERLRQEVEDLKRQLQEKEALLPGSQHAAAKRWHPSGLTMFVIFLAVAILLVAGFFAGYIPLRKRNAVIRAEAQVQEQALPRVEVIAVERSSKRSNLQLPGNIEAITEAPVLARASGYIRRRMADIGDRVKAGQPVAEIDAPELDQQVRQAQANLQQAQAALEEANATYEQGQANEELARVTAERWAKLTLRGAVSRQENDTYQAQYKAQAANVTALAKAVAAARSNIAAAQANVARLNELKSYEVVKAPFDGVITLRNIDVGALVNAGSTLLFRIAQTGTVRVYVNVPQSDASSIHPGQPARLSISNLPGRQFSGTVARMANALDPSSRTMVVEVQAPNGSGALLPGMYAEVDLSDSRANPPLVVPGNALVVRADGTSVAVVRPDHTVHLQKVTIGRDYGDRLEVLGGLQEGETIIANPGDVAREGDKVQPVPAAKPAAN
ncbi:MAG TPA: efflux RND transporter periplasmic adaptor subunit [Bryobacteraceae bacterium]|nr:efflux RND transporter periplasmic adaptor subunit [Bryobacteraceae bacterium]